MSLFQKVNSFLKYKQMTLAYISKKFQKQKCSNDFLSLMQRMNIPTSQRKP